MVAPGPAPPAPGLPQAQPQVQAQAVYYYVVSREAVGYHVLLLGWARRVSGVDPVDVGLAFRTWLRCWWCW